MSLFDLRGKTAVVTGSTRGIGRAIVEALARQGARVVVSSRKQEACDEVARALTAEGHEALAVAAHVGKKGDLENLVAKTRERFGQIDILVCNAAINPAFGPLSQIQDDAFDKIFATNVRSTLWLCNMVLPEMAARKDGAVVIVSSITAVRGNPVIGAYGMSKAAEAGLARNLAVEWGAANIRINTIAPGLVKTDFARMLWQNEELSKKLVERTPLQRIADPEDIAGAAVFLASPAARYITGQLLLIDGGTSIVDSMV